LGARGSSLYAPSSTAAQEQAINVGVPLIQRSPTGVFTLTIG